MDEKIREVALRILEYMNFDLEVPAVQEDADEIVRIMIDNGLEAK